MGRLAGFSHADVRRKVLALGFGFEAHGSRHDIYRHPVTKARAVIPRHSGDLKEGTLKGMLKDAGISVEEFLAA